MNALLSSTAMPVVLLSWKPMVKGVLRGFATVRIGKSLTVHDVTLCSNNGKMWASLPSKPMMASDGTALRDDKQKIRYVPLLEWADRETRDRFSLAVIEAVRREHGAEALEPTA